MPTATAIDPQARDAEAARRLQEAEERLEQERQRLDEQAAGVRDDRGPQT